MGPLGSMAAAPHACLAVHFAGMPFQAMGATPLRASGVCLAVSARQGHRNRSEKFISGAILLVIAFRAMEIK